jgi:hypothetical protein
MPRLATPADNLTDRVLAAARYITPRFWTGDVSSFADLLDQNVVFASIASRTFIYGKRDVSLRIAEIARVYRENGKIQLHDERYNVRELNDGLCMATARYLCAIEHLGDSQPGRRRSFYVLSSMTWRRASNEFGCELLLCHNSERSLMSRLVDDLPTSSGERLALPMTADALSSTARIALRMHDAAGTTHWIVPGTVVFVQAARQYSIVNCVDRSIRMRGSFTSIVQQLTEAGITLLKVHRSYAVNPTFVEYLEGDVLHMTTGELIPIPSRRVDEVRSQLTDLVMQAE